MQKKQNRIETTNKILITSRHTREIKVFLKSLFPVYPIPGKIKMLPFYLFTVFIQNYNPQVHKWPPIFQKIEHNTTILRLRRHRHRCRRRIPRNLRLQSHLHRNLHRRIHHLFHFRRRRAYSPA